MKFPMIHKKIMKAVMVCIITVSMLGTPYAVAQASALALLPGQIQQVLGQIWDGVTQSLSLATDVADESKEFGLDAVAFSLSNATLNRMSRSVINWANSGLDGSPLAIENYGILFDDINTDITIDYLNRLNDIDNPQARQAIQSVANNFNTTPEQLFSATFDRLCQNASGGGCSLDAFTDGALADGGGLLGLTTYLQDENNPIGVRRQLESTINSEIVKITQEKITELTSTGFQSEGECLQRAKTADSDGSRPCLVKAIRTPGAIVGEQVTSFLNAGKERSQQADELSEVITQTLVGLTDGLTQRGLTQLQGFVQSQFQEAFDAGTRFIDINDLDGGGVRGTRNNNPNSGGQVGGAGGFQLQDDVEVVDIEWEIQGTRGQLCGDPVLASNIADQDNDKMPDSIDNNPSNPDSDGDGIPDGADVTPYEEGVTRAGQYQDTDNDDIIDIADAAVIDTTTGNLIGDRKPDGDGDGVSDKYDIETQENAISVLEEQIDTLFELQQVRTEIPELTFLLDSCLPGPNQGWQERLRNAVNTELTGLRSESAQADHKENDRDAIAAINTALKSFTADLIDYMGRPYDGYASVAKVPRYQPEECSDPEMITVTRATQNGQEQIFIDVFEGNFEKNPYPGYSGGCRQIPSYRKLSSNVTRSLESNTNAEKTRQEIREKTALLNDLKAILTEYSSWCGQTISDENKQQLFQRYAILKDKIPSGKLVEQARQSLESAMNQRDILVDGILQCTVERSALYGDSDSIAYKIINNSEVSALADIYPDLRSIDDTPENGGIAIDAINPDELEKLSYNDTEVYDFCWQHFFMDDYDGETNPNHWLIRERHDKHHDNFTGFGMERTLNDNGEFVLSCPDSGVECDLHPTINGKPDKRKLHFRSLEEYDKWYVNSLVQGHANREGTRPQNWRSYSKFLDEVDEAVPGFVRYSYYKHLESYEYTGIKCGDFYFGDKHDFIPGITNF